MTDGFGQVAGDDDRHLGRCGDWPDPRNFRYRTEEITLSAAHDIFTLFGLLSKDHSQIQLISGEKSALLGIDAAATLDLGPKWAEGAEVNGQVSGWLESIPDLEAAPSPHAVPGASSGRVGSCVTAVGSLPFDRGEPGHLFVPRVLIRWDGARTTGTVVSDTAIAEIGSVDIQTVIDEVIELAQRRASDAIGLSGDRTEHKSIGDSVEYGGEPSKDDGYLEAVTEAVRAIKAGKLQKVVLSRELKIEAPEQLSIEKSLQMLAYREPNSTIFAIQDEIRGEREIFFGASPELLVSLSADHVVSHPLAGTVRISENSQQKTAAISALMASPKCSSEHRLVVDAISRALQDICEDLTVPDQPETIELRSVAHLGTRITGRLSKFSAPQDSATDALGLAARLHPTPAVGGTPTPTALTFIANLETGSRGLYAGPVGWVDANGDGRFVIGIRSASLSRNEITLRSGAGIVEGSQPAEELAETSWKLQTMLDVLWPHLDNRPGALPAKAAS